MKPIYEFLLWNNCGNNCAFCWQRAHEKQNDDKILNSDQQIDSIDQCKHFLDTEFEQGNHILLVGGEIFDIKNEEVKHKFMWLLIRIIEKMTLNEIDLLYINTNLLYEDVSLLDWFLSTIEANGLFDRLKFTTSYDIVGRYANKEREFLFYKNLKHVTDKYKDVHVVVNTVLTQEACKRIKNNTFGADYLLEYLKQQGKDTYTIKDWIEYFRVDINTIPYIILNSEDAPGAPTKEDIFSTLIHIDAIMPGYLNRYAENIALKQEKRLYEFNKIDNKYIYCSSDMNDCGHSVNFKRSFADSDECYPCQIEKLAKYSNK